MPVYKRATGLVLTDAASWASDEALTTQAASAPGSTDVVVWKTGSSGGAHTGAVAYQGIQVEGALTSPISLANVTVGTGGITQLVTNNTRLNMTTLGVGATNQTWTLYNTGASSGSGDYALWLDRTGDFTGSSTISVVNAGGASADPYKAYIYLRGVKSFTGTLSLGASTSLIFIANGTSIGSATLKIAGAGVKLNSGSSASTYYVNNLVLESGVTWGGAGATLQVGNLTTGGVTTPTLTLDLGMYVVGNVTGTTALTKAGTAMLTVDGDWTTLPGLAITAGTFRAAGNITKTFSGTLSGAGTFERTSTGGTVTLTNPNIEVANLLLGGGTIAFAPATTQSVTSAIKGSGAVTFNGPGTTTLNGVGDSTGAWTVNSPGTLVISAAQNGTSGPITVNNGATLTVSANVAKPITVASGGSAGVTGGSGAITLTGNGLTLGAGTYTGSHRIGNTAGATTRLNVTTGRTLSAVSDARFGSVQGNTTVVQTGGTLSNTSVSGGSAFAASSSASYTYYKGTGGTISSAQSWYFAINPDTGYGPGGPLIADIDGTSVTLSTVYAASSSNFGDVVHTISSGTHSAQTLALGWNYLTAPTGTGKSFVFSLRGASTSLSASSATYLNYASSTIPVQLNVSGGATINAGAITTYNSTTVRVHINSGTLGLTGTSTRAASSLNMKTYLYGTSNKFFANGTTAIFPFDTETATGSGVTDIPLTSLGSGYAGAPYVVISGGGGEGATAKANWDATTGSITSITVTNPGVNYTAAPTVTLSMGSGPAPTSAAVVNQAGVTIGANPTTAGFEKTGASTLALTGAHTGTGATTVSAGTLQLGSGTTSASGSLGPVTAAAGYGTGSVVLAGGTLAFGRNENLTYGGVISSTSAAGGIKKVATTAVVTTTVSGDNTFTGPIASEHGTLKTTHVNGFGASNATAAITVSNNACVEFDANGTTTSSRALSLTGTGVSSGGALKVTSGNVTLSGNVSFPSQNGVSLAAATGATLRLDGVISNSFGGYTLSKIGAGTVILAGTNTFGWAISVAAGFLGFTGSVQNNTNGNFGNGSLAGNLTIAANAGIRYYGTNDATFSRAYSFTGASGSTNYIESDGVGALNVSTPPSYLTNPMTLGLGGSGTANNTISYQITNIATTNAVSIAKAGTGKWVLSNTSNSYTGNTTVSGGTLALLVASWATNAKVTGSSTVVVGGSGKIQPMTGSGTAATKQNGKHTYTALTFQSGGTIRIGG